MIGFDVPSNITNLTGKVFDGVEILGFAGWTKVVNGERKALWIAKCTCGNIWEVRGASISRGYTKSCGCLKMKALLDRSTVHGQCGTGAYNSYNSMLERCYNPKSKAYKAYGACGISVCDKWNPRKGGSFAKFFSDMGERPEGTTLNRIRGSQIYSKETCEWADYSTQGFDRRRKSTNTSGRTGVYWLDKLGVWTSKISVEGKVQYLGFFKDFSDAVTAREMAELKHYGWIKE